MDDVCTLCAEQTPVVGIDGTTYDLEKLCCPEGGVWVRFGLSDQSSTWTQYDETFIELDYEVHMKIYVIITSFRVS